MSTRGTNTALLMAMLAVTGTALGAGIYESRVVIPQWAARPTPTEIGPALHRSGHLMSGRVFWPLVGVPIVPLAAENLRRAVRSPRGPRRPWWLASASTIAVASVATATYFVPSLHRLAHVEQVPEVRIRAMVARRVALDRLRLAVGGAAWIAGLTALSRPELDRPTVTTAGGDVS